MISTLDALLGEETPSNELTGSCRKARTPSSSPFFSPSPHTSFLPSSAFAVYQKLETERERLAASGAEGKYMAERGNFVSGPLTHPEFVLRETRVLTLARAGEEESLLE